MFYIKGKFYIKDCNRGIKSWALSPLRRVRQFSSYSLRSLQCSGKYMYKAVEGPNTRHMVLSVITGSYCQRWRRLTIFAPCEIKFAGPLTLQAVQTIWRALSKPPQRPQGHDPGPLWLLVGTPSGFEHELACRLRVAQPSLMDVPIYFWYYYTCLCTTFLWSLRFGWLFFLSLHKEDYLQNFLMCVLLITRLLRLVWSLNRFNHISGVTIITPTDRPKSIRNCCVIKILVVFLCFVTLLFWIFLWVYVLLS